MFFIISLLVNWFVPYLLLYSVCCIRCCLSTPQLKGSKYLGSDRKVREWILCFWNVSWLLWKWRHDDIWRYKMIKIRLSGEERKGGEIEKTILENITHSILHSMSVVSLYAWEHSDCKKYTIKCQATFTSENLVTCWEILLSIWRVSFQRTTYHLTKTKTKKFKQYFKRIPFYKCR